MIYAGNSDGRRAPASPTTSATRFPGKILLGGDSVSAQPLACSLLFHHLLCSASCHFQSPTLTIKLLCDFIHSIGFEHGKSGCPPPSICCHLFPGPATFLITGAVTLANKPILVILVGFWQPVIPQPKFYFTLVTASHIQALSTHPASSCQMHLAQQLPVAPHCLSNYGQGLQTNIYNPLCSGTSHFPASLPCFLCTCSQIQLNPPTILSSKPYKG